LRFAAADTQSVRNSTAAFAPTEDSTPRRRDRWRSLGARWRLSDDPLGDAGLGETQLIDTHLVRVELARLRGPRPATPIHRARATHWTVSAGA